MEVNSSTKLLFNFFLDDWKLIAFLTFVFTIYFYYTSTFNYFEKRGVRFIKPTIFFGNFAPRFTKKMSSHDFQVFLYNHFKGNPFGGVFEGRRPVYYIRDEEIIKSILIRDFDHFVDRNTLVTNEPRHIKQMLNNLKGTEWKSVRSVLTPTFSSARLKNMLPIIELCTQQMVEYLKKIDQNEMEMKDTMGHFTLEVIGACAFGIKCGALTNENEHFFKIAEKFNYMTKVKRFMLFTILMFVPQLFRFMNISFFNQKAIQELLKILKISKAERRSSAVRKNDFLQLVVNAADKEKHDSEENNSIKLLDEDTIDAQSLLFLIAGFETSSTLLSFAIYTLAKEPELQDKLRNHIEEVTSGKEISYELLSHLDYLEAFLLETLRVYPPVPRIDRKCTKPYVLPNSSVTLKVNDIVVIPVYGIHMDPNIYPNPEEFRPERFMNEEKNQRPSHLFLAFGAGPRNCIGLRFAMYSAKSAMVALLKNFKFSPCSKTEDCVEFDKTSMLLKANLWVRVEKL